MSIEPYALPQLSAARVLTSGGPYLAGSVLSLAFVDPLVGRLYAHAPHSEPTEPAARAIVPETISVVLLGAAPPYEHGETIALSFVDPCVARIHRWAGAGANSGAAAHGSPTAPHAPARPSELAIAATVEPEPDAPESPKLVGLQLEWTSARVGRLLSLSEKLLAIDRLGWYRHALAMRLLLPDEIVIAHEGANETAARQLRVLKIAATEALGTPLLAALMPNFNVDEEWLRSIETPALARAAAALRETLTAHSGRGDERYAPPANAPRLSVGTLRRRDFEGAAGNGLDAFLAALIPSEGATPELAARLSEYKEALVELFGQTAQAPATVRTTRLANPNPVLDERLTAVAREIDRAFSRLAVA
jgi:hypothetical protein